MTRVEQLENENAALRKELEEVRESLSELIRDLTDGKQSALRENDDNYSLVDRLADIYNHRTVYKFFQTEVERYHRYGNIFSILYIKIDQLDNIFKVHDREMVIKVLATTANVVKYHLRSVDIVGRWHEDEFIVISPFTTGDNAKGVAERLRREIAGYEWEDDIEISISVGITEAETGDNLFAMINRAETKLKSSRQNGGNKVTM